MKELRSPHGDCEPSEDYVQSKCLAECNAKYVVGMCNCKAIYMPGKNKCDVYIHRTDVVVVLSYGEQFNYDGSCRFTLCDD